MALELLLGLGQLLRQGLLLAEGRQLVGVRELAHGVGEGVRRLVVAPRLQVVGEPRVVLGLAEVWRLLVAVGKLCLGIRGLAVHRSEEAPVVVAGLEVLRRRSRRVLGKKFPMLRWAQF